MFRICKAEFKKLFYKPGIYVLAGILIFVLACCSFLYSPSDRDKYYVTPSSSANTVDKFYTELNGTLANSLNNFERNIDSAQSFIDSYVTENDIIGSLNAKVEAMYQQYVKFRDSLSRGSTADTKTERNKFIESFTDFKNYYSENVGKYDNQFGGVSQIGKQEIHVLTNAKLNRQILSQVTQWHDDMVNYSSAHSDEEVLVNDFVREIGSKFSPILSGYINKLKPFQPDASYVNSLYEYVNVARTKISEIRAEIDQFHEANKSGTENTRTSNINHLSLLATKFKLHCNETLELVTNGIYLNALKDYSGTQLNSFYGLENFNFYEAQETQSKLIYYSNHGTCSMDYANPFNLMQPSNFKINCYDFSYYALRLCMFIIIIYVVTVAATTITGELQSGTMKMLAIRPYKREKILGGKLLATLLIGIILILVSAVATLIMGLISYGGASMQVLVVFNATKAVAMSPFALYAIMLLTLMVEMVFFVLLAMAISLLFKSQIGSVAVSILAFFGTLVLNTLLGKSAWLAVLPFTNINLYKYFGSSFVSTSNDFLASVLTSPVANGVNFWISAVYTLISIIGLTVLIFEVFKRRDMR